MPTPPANASAKTIFDVIVDGINLIGATATRNAEVIVKAAATVSEAQRTGGSGMTSGDSDPSGKKGNTLTGALSKYAGGNR